MANTGLRFQRRPQRQNPPGTFVVSTRGLLYGFLLRFAGHCLLIAAPAYGLPYLFRQRSRKHQGGAKTRN